LRRNNALYAARRISMFPGAKTKTAAVAVLLALLIVPAPLLPPIGLAEMVQSAFGVNWKIAYLISTIGLLITFYGALGLVTAFAVGPGRTPRQYWLRLVLVPVIMIGLAMLVRSLKLGHVPMLANALVPIVACAFGVIAGLLFQQRGWRTTLVVILVLVSSLLWAYWPGGSSELNHATKAQLERLVADAEKIPTGEDRFGGLLRLMFAPLSAAATPAEVLEHNRAAILALGIAIGDERLARLVGLDRNSDLVRSAAALRPGTTLRGREDWARHYCLSAALTLVATPFISESGGLIKEQLDALTRGSGFSFADLAADRAGVRFARAATDSEAAALKMQKNLQNGYSVDDYFPAVADLPENLTTEQFRHNYGGAGAPRYRRVVDEIDARLNRCAALAPP
jgi:hypothetical protein